MRLFFRGLWLQLRLFVNWLLRRYNPDLDDDLRRYKADKKFHNADKARLRRNKMARQRRAAAKKAKAREATQTQRTPATTPRRRKPSTSNKKAVKSHVWSAKSLLLVTVVVVAAAAATTLVVNSLSHDQAKVVAVSQSPTTNASPSTTPSSASLTTQVAGNTWKMAYGDYLHNRWFGNGIAAIRTAKTKTQAANAANVWLSRVQLDPILLAGATQIFLNKNVQAASLIGKNHLATLKAAQLVAELQLVFANSNFKPAYAPTNGTNSGLDRGHVVSAYYAGVSGNRKAVMATLPSGKKVWIMARCGNPVVIGKSSLPPGKTEQLESKIASQDPFRQGHAPIGGGHNKGNGTGKYISPGDMKTPPPAPRVNPSAPTPKPAPSATSDPESTPTPEASGGTQTGAPSPAPGT